MGTYVENDSFSAELRAGKHLIADVTRLRAPFGWVAILPGGAEASVRGSLSKTIAGAEWVVPTTNAALAATTIDIETGPLRFLRWTHAAGATIELQMCGLGEVRFTVEDQ